jgi:hypothetical protein
VLETRRRKYNAFPVFRRRTTWLTKDLSWNEIRETVDNKDYSPGPPFFQKLDKSKGFEILRIWKKPTIKSFENLPC